MTSSRRRRCAAFRASIVLLGSVVAGCSGGPSLADEEKEQVIQVLAAAPVGVTLTVGSADCIYGGLDQDQAESLLAQEAIAGELTEPVAALVVDCVGSEPLATAVLGGLAPQASAEELRCAAAHFEPEVLVGIVASSLEEATASRPAVELAVGTSLAMCLTPEHLLDQGN